MGGGRFCAEENECEETWRSRLSKKRTLVVVGVVGFASGPGRVEQRSKVSKRIFIRSAKKV